MSLAVRRRPYPFKISVGLTLHEYVCWFGTDATKSPRIKSSICREVTLNVSLSRGSCRKLLTYRPWQPRYIYGGSWDSVKCTFLLSLYFVCLNWYNIHSPIFTLTILQKPVNICTFGGIHDVAPFTSTGYSSFDSVHVDGRHHDNWYRALSKPEVDLTFRSTISSTLFQYGSRPLRWNHLFTVCSVPLF